MEIAHSDEGMKVWIKGRDPEGESECSEKKRNDTFIYCFTQGV